MERTVFPPKDQSVHKQAIRISNDIEGWHKYNALSRRRGGRSALPALLTHLTVGEGGPTDKHHHKAIFKCKTPQYNYSASVIEMFKGSCSVSGHSTKGVK